MPKAIFTIKTGSRCDDRREQYYHFPRSYLNQVQAAVGDCIIYYEPRRSEGGSGRQAYFATAKVEEVVPDQTLPDHFYAHLSGYLDFDAPATFIESGEYYESAFRRVMVQQTRVRSDGQSVRFPKENLTLFCAPGFPRN